MVDISRLTKRMSALRHFKDLSLSDVEMIVMSGSIRRFAAERVICMEDEPCAGLFVLLSGQVQLYRLGPEGQEVLIDSITPVIMFNEVAILDGGTNPMTAVASKNCIVWNAHRDALLVLSERFPKVALGFLPILAARNRALIALYTDVCFRSVPARTAKLLLELSDYGQIPIIRQEHTINQMSAQISTVPEAISRSLSHFCNEGLIDRSRTHIVVCNSEKLAELALLDPINTSPEQQIA